MIKKYFWTIFWIIMILLVIFVFRFIRVSGDSMYPTIEDGTLGIANIFRYDVEQGDVVVAYQNGTAVIKRVIACPGDTVYISEDDEVYINGELYETEEGTYIESEYCGIEITLSEDEYFLMGDNRAYSADSRIYGPNSKVFGKVILLVG